MNLETNSEPRVPAELADALKANASLLCDAAVRFLLWSGRKWDPDFDLGAWDFPLGFLAELGLALQLVAWEQRGLYSHREAGLPSADDAVIRTFASYEQFGPAGRGAGWPAVSRLFPAGRRDRSMDCNPFAPRRSTGRKQTPRGCSTL